MRVLHLLCWTFPIFGLACATNRVEQREAEGSVLLEAYRRGVMDAVGEIGRNEMTMYVVGWPQPERDEETGLPTRQIGGDAVDPLTFWRMTGHNEVIKAYVSAGPPTDTDDATRKQSSGSVTDQP